jgi:hypothetical protein
MNGDDIGWIFGAGGAADSYLRYDSARIDFFSSGGFDFMTATNTDLPFNFIGTTNSGLFTWMEDEDYFQYSDDIFLLSGETLYTQGHWSDVLEDMNLRMSNNKINNEFLSRSFGTDYKEENKQTVTLAAGNNQIHSFIFAKGYIFGGTRTSPAKFIRFNDLDDLTDYTVTTFANDGKHDNAESAIYDPTQDKIYILFDNSGNVNVTEFDPDDLSNSDVIDSNTEDAGASGSITSDGTYLYILGRTTDADIYKYDFATYSLDSSAEITGFDNGHSLQYDGTNLYATGSSSPAWVAKIAPSDLSFSTQAFAAGDNTATDDFAIAGDFLYVGLEATNGIINRVSKSDLSLERLATGWTSACYGVYFDGRYVWGAYSTSPGTIVRLDPTTLEVTSYILDTGENTPNSIISDGQRIFITCWLSPAQVIRKSIFEYSGDAYAWIDTSGNQTLALDVSTPLLTLNSDMIIDNTGTEALLVRQDADAADVFIVDTSNKEVEVYDSFGVGLRPLYPLHLLASATDGRIMELDGSTNDYTGTGGGFKFALNFTRDMNAGNGNDPDQMVGMNMNLQSKHTDAAIAGNRTVDGYSVTVADSGVTWSNSSGDNRIVKYQGATSVITSAGNFNSTGVGRIINDVIGTNITMSGTGDFNATGGAVSQHRMYGNRIAITNQPALTAGTLWPDSFGSYITVLGSGTGASAAYGYYVRSITGADANYGIYINTVGGDAGDWAIYDVSSRHWALDGDNQRIYWGEVVDSYIEFDNDSMNLVANNTTATDDMELTAEYVTLMNATILQVNSAGDDKNIQIKHDDTDGDITVSAGELNLAATVFDFDSNSNSQNIYIRGTDAGAEWANLFVNAADDFNVYVNGGLTILDSNSDSECLRLVAADAANDYADFSVNSDGELTIMPVARNVFIGDGTDGDNALGFFGDTTIWTLTHDDDDGTLRMSANDAANYTLFAADGLMTMAGTARTTRNLIVLMEGGQGAAAPTARTSEDPYLSWTFAINDDNEHTIEAPHDMDYTQSMNVYVVWYTSVSQVDDEVNWQLEWNSRATGETVNAGATTDTSGDVNCPAQWVIAETLVETIPGNSIAADDVVGLDLKRIAIVDGTDPQANTIHVLNIHAEYICNKLGEAT